VNPHQQLIALLTIVRKEIKRFTRIWMQTLLPPVITMSLYFIIFGALIGSRIGQMGGVDYMAFVVPGLIMMSVITNSYSNVASSFFSTKFQRSVEEILVSPTPNYIILLGFTLGGVMRGLCVGLIVTVVSLFFTDLSIQHYGITRSVVFLTAVLFSIAGFLNALFAQRFDDISIIPTFILTPLTYLGGVFYTIGLLPEFCSNMIADATARLRLANEVASSSLSSIVFDLINPLSYPTKDRHTKSIAKRSASMRFSPSF